MNRSVGDSFRLFMRRNRRSRRGLIFLLILVAVLLILNCTLVNLHRCFSSIAMSEAQDRIARLVSDSVKELMDGGDYGYDYFVTVQKDADGAISAISANMSRINSMSAELIGMLSEKASKGMFDIYIPLGSATGLGFLSDKGPSVPVRVNMLTSSSANFTNELVSSGINQTKHLITLHAKVNIVLIVPWSELTSTVDTDVLVAETVIVGKVPDTYVTLEGINGSE